MDETRQSLLLRAQAGETDAGQDLTDLYRPLILGWLNRQGVPAGDLEDLSQEVLLSVVKHLPGFQHAGHRGAFRSWLRTIVCSRTADYWRALDASTPASGGSGAIAALQQIADPGSELNREWDEEHDRYVLHCLLDMVDEEFEPITLKAFRRLALDGVSGAEAARELGLSVAAVYVAKSRVLARIRQERKGLSTEAGGTCEMSPMLCKVFRPLAFSLLGSGVGVWRLTNPGGLVTTEAALNHPNDETLRALSLGQLTEAELVHVSAHLGECAACCGRIDQLATDDRLLVRLQQNAASREKVLVAPDQRSAAVRALRSSHQARSAPRKRGADTVPSGTADAAAVETHRDGRLPRRLLDEPARFLAPAERPDEIGRLGPYRILGVLGQGGMGVVFRAHDPGLDRLVALKAMLPGVAAMPTATERFLREARAAAALKHPHVVTIHQVGEDRGVPFLAMEFLEGERLDDRIRRDGRLPLAEVLRIGRETAQGLAAAHARGLVHRDIKPANLWLEAPNGDVKVLDFGLARGQDNQAHLTQSGMIVGTPAYMAPEQAEGKPADPRCDLFSLGCVLYQMTTGTLPFQGDSTIAVLRALALREPPPVGELRPEAPPELSALVARLLAKKPEDRPASAQEVAETLHALEQLPTRRAGSISDGPSSSVTYVSGSLQPVPGPGRRSRKPLVAVAFAALAVVLTLIVVLWPTPHGTVRIETDDPTVEVVFDKDGPTIKGADKEPITLRAGEHGILIKRGDFTFEADKLVLNKGAALTLKVELLQGKVQVLQDGQVVASQDIPLPPPLAKAPFDSQQARDYQNA